jgi:hypothetical protein
MIKHRGRHKNINFYFNLQIQLNCFNGGLGTNMRKAWLPIPQAAWIHQIHAAGGMGGSTTMALVFIGLVMCCGWSHDNTSSSYVKNGTKITSR